VKPEPERRPERPVTRCCIIADWAVSTRPPLFAQRARPSWPHVGGNLPRQAAPVEKSYAVLLGRVNLEVIVGRPLLKPLRGPGSDREPGGVLLRSERHGLVDGELDVPAPHVLGFTRSLSHRCSGGGCCLRVGWLHDAASECKRERGT
jgi:hypothetical protein